jgi:hypothetical protein
MFIGEAMCLVVYFLKQYAKRRQSRASMDSYSQLSGGAGRLSPAVSAVNPSSFNVSSKGEGGLLSADVAEAELAAKKPPLWVYAILCVFDLSATAVGGVGLIWVDASTNQMLRGSMVVVSVFFGTLTHSRVRERR